MSIYLRGKSWYYEFQCRGIRYVKALGLITKTQAKREEAAARAKALAGTLEVKTPASSPRFRTFAAEFLAWYAAHRRPNSTKRYRTALQALLPFFGAERLDAIVPLMVERYKRQRHSQGVAPATINLELLCLSALYTCALQWGKATRSPLTQVRRYRVDARPLRVLHPDEEHALLAVCPPPLRLLALAALHTGLRKGELLTLTWRQVDLRHRLVTVEAETAKGHRTRAVPLSQTLTAALQPHQGAHDAAVFLNTKGRPYRHIERVFQMAVIRAGIPYLRFHDLRHTFASRLVQAGVHLRTVQDLLGHRSIVHTQRYAHLSPEQTRQAVAIFDQLPAIVPSEKISVGRENL